MKISEFLVRVREFTDYIASLQGNVEQYGGEALTRWDYILSVYGPTPVIWPRGALGRIFSPLQAVAVGWDDLHDMSLWTVRPFPEQVMSLLELSPEHYEKILRVQDLRPGYHKQLRADLVAACGMPDESTSNWFTTATEKNYNRKRLQETP